MADYSKQIAKAQRKISEKGMPMVFVSISKDNYDPQTDSYSVTETQIDIYGVKTSPTLEEVQVGLFQNNSLVILAAAADFQETPSTKDMLEFSDHTWSIENIKVVSPAEGDILYKIQVKDCGSI